MIKETVSGMIKTVRGTLAFHKSINELNKLTDRDLKDIGLTRYDTIHLAMNMRKNKIGA